MNHVSSYESVSGFLPKVRISVSGRVSVNVGVGFRVLG